MRRYLLRRVLHMALTLFAMATLMFFLFRLLPGDPTATVISPALQPEARAGDARPVRPRPAAPRAVSRLPAQPTRRSTSAFPSTPRGRVSEMIEGRLVNTLLLILPAMIAGLPARAR